MIFSKLGGLECSQMAASPVYRRIRGIADRLGMNDHQICRAAGITTSYMSSLKSGRMRTMGAGKAILVARALGVSVGELLEGPDAKEVAYSNHDRPQALRTITVPVRALVRAGSPEEALEDTGQTFELLPHLHGADREVVRIVGNSMYPLLRDGYLVLIDRKPRTIKNGDVVVAIRNGESTIKRFYKSGRRVVLRAENPEIEPITIEEEDDFRIVGKVSKIVEGEIE